MVTSELICATPYYVLIEDVSPLATPMVGSDSDLVSSAIFGFSGKSKYDAFCLESSTRLKPYPLVKGYLRNQIKVMSEEPDDKRIAKLVILDAAGPCETYVHAATMQAVLNAQEELTLQVTPTCRLIFRPGERIYRLDGQCV